MQVSLFDDRLELSHMHSSTMDEGFAYTIDFETFKITQMTSDGTVTMVANHDNSLYYEAANKVIAEEETPTFWSSFFGPLFEEPKKFGSDVAKGVGLGFWVPTNNLFGLGEREDTLVLKRTTESGQPYELFATDAPHMPDKQTTLYGQLPFVTGISKASAQAFTWINAAHTWVFIDDMSMDQQAGSSVDFVSEAGALEFFMFASSVETKKGSLNRAKRIQENLRTITGAAYLPPVHTLGFHFSKYAPASSDIIRQRNADFTKYEFPVDVLWMDIQWADQQGAVDGYEYFRFNPQNFTTEGIAAMNQEVEDSKRHMTVILDPHIKVDDSYFVYHDGEEEQAEEFAEDGSIINIFVKQADTDEDFQGTCWPGESVWIDFMNENAQEYWGGLYSYDKFIGSSKIYHAWNDMNEPSVFSTAEKTIPGDSRHIKADGTVVLHRDMHNAYGALQQRSSYRGLLKRDNNELRPFVLTRSFFLGSQKFGGYWTGDNYAVDAEVQGSMTMLLQNSLAGAIFGGSDVPGFIGVPSDELYIRFYQMGSWEPFFRAHSDINNQDREPWIQSQRVQDAIRDAINTRYDFIHYLYTTFEQATQTGEPLMRTMWSEFPDDEQMYTMSTQFMLGDSLLIAPKITTPTAEQDASGIQVVDVTFPAGEALWYSYMTKKLVDYEADVAQTLQLTDLEQAVYVREASILPLLLHDGCMAVLDCIDEPLRLEVYPDLDGFAQGKLYLDDGESHQYQDGQFEELTLKFQDSMVTVVANDSSDYESNKVVNQVSVYGYGGLGPLAVTQDGHALDYTFEDGSLDITVPGTPVKDLNIYIVMRC